MSEVRDRTAEGDDAVPQASASASAAGVSRSTGRTGMTVPEQAEARVEADVPAVTAGITEQPIDEAAVRDAVDGPECGAVVMFHGVIRNHDGGEGVRALDYSAHPDAERFLAEVVAAEQERTGLRLAAVHRIGALRIGDAALVAAAAAAHRAEAFDAIERLVERIKAEVPIWKRQHYADGASGWVGL